jgi:hypothetical protein
MIDPEQLRALGWGEDLIEAVTRTAARVREAIGVFDAAPVANGHGVMSSTELYVTSSRPSDAATQLHYVLPRDSNDG